MTTFAKPRSRIDLLLTLGRLALPDALKRADQAPVVAIGLALLYLVVATVSTLALLPFLFGIEDDGLRRNLLNLSACVVVLFWILAQVVLRLPVTWLLDLEYFLPLPAAYRDLYVLRLALSLVGYWLVGLGPAAIYVLATQSSGPLHLVLAATALVALVLLLGRLAAILTIAIDQLIESLIGLIGMFLATAGTIYGAGILISVLDGETAIETVAASIRESAVLSAAGFTPPGLLVAILDSPNAFQANFARLGALLILLAGAILIEQRLVLRQVLSRPGGDRRTAAPVTPLALLLRRTARLPPAASLTLVEVECAFRAKGVRWAYTICLGYAMSASIDLLLGVLGAAFLTIILLNSVRTEKPPPSCQVWRESLTLPLSAFRIFRVPALVPSLLVVPVALLATAVGVAHFGWSNWRLGVLAGFFLPVLLLLADGAYSLVQLYWPKRKIGGAAEVEPENLAAGLVAQLPIVAFFALSAIGWRIAEESERGTLIAGISAVAIVMAAALAWRAATARQRREIESRAHELLLRNQVEKP